MNTHHDTHRARAYTGLALGFDRPSDDLIGALESGDLADVLASAGITLEVPAMSAAAADLADATVDRASIAEAYARSFGLEAEDGVPLYEIAYTPGSLVTNTDVMADIAGFYRAFGLATADGGRDRVDALSTELEYLGYLAMRRGEHIARGEDDAVEIITDATASFLDDHLGRWQPRLTDEIRDEVDHPVYRALAAALAALVEADCDRFGAAPDTYEAVPTAPLEAIAGLDSAAGRTDLACGANPPCMLPSMEGDQ